jgi:hypothetical protein
MEATESTLWAASCSIRLDQLHLAVQTVLTLRLLLPNYSQPFPTNIELLLNHYPYFEQHHHSTNRKVTGQI